MREKGGKHQQGSRGWYEIYLVVSHEVPTHLGDGATAAAETVDELQHCSVRVDHEDLGKQGKQARQAGRQVGR